MLDSLSKLQVGKSVANQNKITVPEKQHCVIKCDSRDFPYLMIVHL